MTFFEVIELKKPGIYATKNVHQLYTFKKFDK